MGGLGVGDWVECIKADNSAGLLQLGEQYQIEAVHDFVPHMGDVSSDWHDCAVDLVGVPRVLPDLAWGLYRFRPKSSLIEGLLKPADTPAEPERVNA